MREVWDCSRERWEGPGRAVGKKWVWNRKAQLLQVKPSTYRHHAYMYNTESPCILVDGDDSEDA